MTTEIKQIVKKLDHIQSEVDYIRKHLRDMDKLTDDDVESLNEAEEDLKANKTKRL